jgi:hypothetical protein
MITIYNENIITDLRKAGIRISKDMFDTINEYVDINNSTIRPLTISTYRELKDKTVMIADGSDIIAVYGNNKFMYNPTKMKISSAPDYDIYEIEIGGVNVQNRRQQRRDYLSGLVNTRNSSLSNLPKSSNYVWSKDYDPEVNKVYYTRLLQQNNLQKYAIELEEAYDVVKDLIDQRRDRLTGKRTEYDRMITDISKQIGKIEDEMIAAERDFSFDVDKLKKELSKLPRLVKNAKDFMEYERQEYATFGKRKPIPYNKITK